MRHGIHCESQYRGICFIQIPVTVKIRLLPSMEDTLKLAHAIEDSGCSILTIHGRTKEMIKQKIGPCDFEKIRKIKSELKIPVFANGGIGVAADVERALELTQADGTPKRAWAWV